MSNLYEFAEFLVASWKLGAPEKRMPTSHGVLDAALYRLLPKLPTRYRGLLSFGDTRLGFRCHELPQVLYCAQANLLTSQPNPNYLTADIQISEETACELLLRQGVDPVEADDFGSRLEDEVSGITADYAAGSSPRCAAMGA